jgi:hypothetical protein
VLFGYWSFSGVRFAGTAHSVAGGILAFMLLATVYLLPLVMGLWLWVHERERHERPAV